MANEVRYEWDEAKRASNLGSHGVDFETVVEFDWTRAVTVNQSVRGERRFVSYSVINERLHVLVWTLRNEAVRVISLRKANTREENAYEQI